MRVFIDGYPIGFIREFEAGYQFISQLPGSPGRSRKYWPTASDCQKAVERRFTNATFEGDSR